MRKSLLFSKQKPLLYFVTPEIGSDFTSWEALIHQAVKGGAGLIQIRDKESSTKKIGEAAIRLRPFLKSWGVPLLINDRVEAACIAQAEGVHLGQEDMPASQARSILGPDALIGLSVETEEQARQAIFQPIDYIAASPVFSSKTKLDCTPPWGLLRLQELCRFSPYPVVAIGGINLSNIEEILACGVEAVALISAIKEAPCPFQATQEILTKVRKYDVTRMG